MKESTGYFLASAVTFVVAMLAGTFIPAPVGPLVATCIGIFAGAFLAMGFILKKGFGE